MSNICHYNQDKCQTFQVKILCYTVHKHHHLYLSECVSGFSSQTELCFCNEFSEYAKLDAHIRV